MDSACWTGDGQVYMYGYISIHSTYRQWNEAVLEGAGNLVSWLLGFRV